MFAALLTVWQSDLVAADFPGVMVYATGGTIAGAAKSGLNTTTYKAGSMGVQDLLEAVPELKSIANISSKQISNVRSADIYQNTLLTLAKEAQEKLKDPNIHGIVVTHGTDTLEETAFFLDLTIRSPKPVVVVGSMRPATAISADGPMNLLQAVSLAASPEASNRGVLVSLNDRIGSAFYTVKTNTTALDTFRASEQGYLGMFIGAQPRFFYTAATPTAKPYFDVSTISSLPKVSIIYMHEDQSNEQIDSAIQAGAKGLIIAGSGNGAVPTTVRERLAELKKAGYPVIRSSRTGSGFTTTKPESLGAGILNPQKARILLMLALANQSDLAQIARYFNEP
ncbi:type II asparaginase [Cupriavidus sp. DF5525]|uniref:type II asparaginase n=1 Tax=Cupriavidus sp. DF5525 TaxID=3160989 RepID=UPI0032DF6324